MSGKPDGRLTASDRHERARRRSRAALPPRRSISSPPFPALLPTESLKQGKREWRVSAYNTGNEEGDLTAYVHCREGKGVKTKQAEETLSTDEFDSVEARCSRKQRVVSGGFDLDANWTTTGSYGMESLKVGKRGWEVAAYGIGNPHDLVAYAYCEKEEGLVEPTRAARVRVQATARSCSA
jgi:hypothetical protein